MAESRQPISIYVIWHPDDDQHAAPLAKAVLHAAMADPAQPGADRLGVPVRYRTSTGPSELPPTVDLDRTEASVVVVLAGDGLLADPGNVWREYVGRVVEGTAARGDECRRMVLASLTPDALGATDMFRNRNTLRLHGVPVEQHEQELIIAVLRTAALALDPTPVTVFISHAKGDGAAIAFSLKEAIEASRLDKFFDAEEIDDGTSAYDVIDERVRRSASIIILTDQYATREWCRLEAILAKQHNRPLVLVNALEYGEARSVPYLAGIPVVRLGADPAVTYDRAIMALLRELVRHRYFPQRALAVHRSVGGTRPAICSGPPELLSLLLSAAEQGFPVVVYPDPPLGRPERDILQAMRSDLVLLTPTEWLARA